MSVARQPFAGSDNGPGQQCPSVEGGHAGCSRGVGRFQRDIAASACLGCVTLSSPIDQLPHPAREFLDLRDNV